jgi:hypothetical protein
MRDLFRCGLTAPRIAYLIGCHRTTVYRELGMQPTQSRAADSNKPPRAA